MATEQEIARVIAEDYLRWRSGTDPDIRTPPTEAELELVCRTLLACLSREDLERETGRPPIVPPGGPGEAG